MVLHDVTLRHGPTVAVAGLSGTFAAGAMTAILGENGAGKTTLARAIAGLHPVASGRIERHGRIALLPQLSALDRTFPASCSDVAAMGLIRRAGPFRAFTGAERAAVQAALAAVGMADVSARAVAKLSAGQFQRVLFARLLVQDAPVLLLDEPFAGVDEPTAAALLEVIRGLHARGRTVIAVLHDAELARREFSAALRLSRGGGVWEAAAPAALHAA